MAVELEDRVDAISHMSAIIGSTRGEPAMNIDLHFLLKLFRIWSQVQFFYIFQTLIVFKGGLSARYKKSIEEKGVVDETYDEDKMALFRVQGMNPNSMQAIQVDLVSLSSGNHLKIEMPLFISVASVPRWRMALCYLELNNFGTKMLQASSSLNSSYCYILQTGASVFTWIGNLSSTNDHDLLDRILELINPTWQPISVREGSEPDAFWNALGGKGEHPREKEIRRCIEDPHLFTCTFTEGDFKVKEIYNFTQDDLTTEDVLVLDCQREIHVWIGCHSNVKSKQEALGLGLKFLETDILVEGLSLETPIYVVTEGNEPPHFTRFFAWDPSKAKMLGNSFERKLALLKGRTPSTEAPRNSWKGNSRGSTPDGLRSKSVSSNGLRRSGSPAFSLSGSKLNSPSSNRGISETPIARKLFSESTPNQGSPTVETSSPSENVGLTQAYLSEEEFEEKFGMTKQAFYKLAKWRQNKLKLSLHLF
ncbi:hypothetical protein Patl1_31125 [Pistacia atlantica]|uniref:Uncharacterized protein n=1 Tax=Pistacia atlantica TaxID=434234 RepID=A0ACC1AEW0_9ROSI|nr:hypothetical protein Patl1_31125 [Pistacia atlantica]